MKKFLKVLGIILVAVIIGPILIGLTMRTFKSPPPPAGELFDVGGYKLHISCTGPKNDLPALVVETGSGTMSPLYHWIQRYVSEITEVCVYDRAGLGRSEESGLLRDSETVATALHALLDKAEIKKPFVFAGHSIAGLYMRQYVEQYPADVAGIAFLDASHPGQGEALGMNIGDQLQTMEQQFSVAKWFIKLGLSELYNPFLAGPEIQAYPVVIQEQLEASSARLEHIDASYAEMRDFNSAAEQAGRNKSLGDRPIVVITAGKKLVAEALPAGVDPERWQDTWITLQKDITALSSNGRHVVMESADHMSLITDKGNAEKAAAHIKNLIVTITEGQASIKDVP